MDQASCRRNPCRALLAFAREALGVADVVIDAVEDVDAVRMRGQDDSARARTSSARGPARCERGFPWPDRWCPSRSRQAASRNRAPPPPALNVEDRTRRFDHGPDARLEIGLHVEQTLTDRSSCSTARDFRHQNGVRHRRAPQPVMSSTCHCVSMPLMRMNSSRGRSRRLSRPPPPARAPAPWHQAPPRLQGRG